MDTLMNTRSVLPPEMERLLRQEIADGETVLWNGQPDPSRAARQAKNIALCLFGIPFTAFALGWETMAVRMAFGLPMMSTSPPMPSGNMPPMNMPSMAPPAPFQGMMLFFLLFGLPFVLTGLSMLTAPYWAWRKAHKVVYAVTDKRALILEPNWRGHRLTRILTADTLKDRTRTQNADGSGTLIFNRLTTRQSGGEGGTVTVTVGFEQISEVRAVDDLIGRTFGSG